MIFQIDLIMEEKVVRIFKELAQMQYKVMESFGKRLAKIRKSRGLTQAELGKKVGVSLRVISYYECESAQPPGAILGNLAEALNISVDELMGTKNLQEKTSPKTARLRKRLMKVENLPPTDQRAVLKYIDMLLDRNRSKTKSSIDVNI